MAEVNLARMNVKLGKYPIAITALRQLSEQANTMGLKYLSVECSVYLSEALLGQKDFKKAQPELQNTLARSEKLGLRSLQAQCHELMGKALQLQGETQEATGQYQQAKANPGRHSKRSEVRRHRQTQRPRSHRQPACQLISGAFPGEFGQKLALPFGLLAHQTPIDDHPSSIAPYAKVG